MHLLLHTFQTIHSLLLRLIHLTLTVRKPYKEIILPYFIITYCNTSWSETDEFESITELLEPVLHVCSTIFFLERNTVNFSNISSTTTTTTKKRGCYTLSHCCLRCSPDSTGDRKKDSR